jgi:trk system potassium uptake protein TrkH
VLAAAFQALTPRTAGFNTIEIGSLNPATLFIIMALMFIACHGEPGKPYRSRSFL